MRVAERPAVKVARGDVKLKVKAASINYRDVLIAKAFYPIVYPRIPLSDAVGRVIEVGEGVTRVAVGDRVCATYYR